MDPNVSETQNITEHFPLASGYNEYVGDTVKSFRKLKTSLGDEVWSNDSLAYFMFLENPIPLVYYFFTGNVFVFPLHTFIFHTGTICFIFSCF